MSHENTGSKSILAKLMATENIIVEHLNIRTARFNVKDRVLQCPIWKDMDGYLYDLLMGHEVGHALYTPPAGWHEAGHDRGQKFRNFLNVIEDARIEKLVKRKYPGLKASFVHGYTSLLERDFFGLNKLQGHTEVLNLIDRINIYAKCGSQVVIAFNIEERSLVSEVENTETWNDVVRVTEKIWKYVKEKEQKKPKNQSELEKLLEELKSQGIPQPSDEEDDSDGSSSNEEDDSDGSSSDDDESAADESDETDSDGSSSDEDGSDKSDEKGDTGKKSEDDADGKSEDGESEDDADGESEDDATDNKSGEGDIDAPKSNKGGVGSENDKSEYQPPKEDPESLTDQAFRDREDELVDASAKPYVFVELPECDLKKTIIPNKMIVDYFEQDSQRSMERHVNPYGQSTPLNYNTMAHALLGSFNRRNAKYIALLVKEFEMRKNARQYARQLESKSGELDTRRLSRYRFSNDIFRKVTEVQQGKSHGMIMFVDMSGSMSGVIRNTIEQVLVLTSFCKKIGIPFEVYGFCDAPTRYPGKGAAYHEFMDNKFTPKSASAFSLTNSNFHLNQLISSDLPPLQFKRAMNMLLVFGGCYPGYRDYSVSNETKELEAITHNWTMDYSSCKLQLHGTPLTECLVASKAVINHFRNTTRADIINVVYLTDGDGCASIQFPPMHQSKNMSLHKFNIGIVDPTTKKSVMVTPDRVGESYQNALTRLITLATGCRHIGFYVGRRQDINRRINEVAQTIRYPSSGGANHEAYTAYKEKANASLRNDGYYKCAVLGYESYYFMPMATGAIIDDEIDVAAGAAKGAILTAFRKSQNKKHSNRAMCSSFAKEIAA